MGSGGELSTALLRDQSADASEQHLCLLSREESLESAKPEPDLACANAAGQGESAPVMLSRERSNDSSQPQVISGNDDVPFNFQRSNERVADGTFIPLSRAESGVPLRIESCAV